MWIVQTEKGAKKTEKLWASLDSRERETKLLSQNILRPGKYAQIFFLSLKIR